MQIASHLPAAGDVFLDARGGERALRVSWHTEAGLVVLSLWRDGVCAGTFRLAVEQVPDLIDLLRAGLDRAYDDARPVAQHPIVPGLHATGEIAG